MKPFDRHPGTRTLRFFGCLALPVLATLLSRVLIRHSTSLAYILWAAAALSFLTGLFAPQHLRRVWIAWNHLTRPIGWLIQHLALALVYFGVFTPLGLLLRLTGRDPLDRRFEPARASYWQTRPSAPSPDSYFKPY